MAWRFRKVFSTGPFRLNLSRRGVGWSWGVPGLRYGVSADGRRYLSVGFPGLGLYWIKYLGPAARDAGRALPLEPESQVTSADPLDRQKWRRLRR
jgi:hypothetical protein